MAEKINQALAPGNIARSRARRDEMQAAKQRTVTMDEALESLLDMADAYRAIDSADAS